MSDYKGHTHGEYDDTCPICYLDAEIDRLRAENSRYLDALLWALGERGDFPMVTAPPYYHWRTELRERAGLKFIPGTGTVPASNRQANENQRYKDYIAHGGDPKKW